MKSPTIAVVLCLGAACGGRQVEPPAGVESQLRAAAADWDRAFNVADVSALVALYAADAISMPFNGPTGQGRAALQTEFQKFFSENESARHETLIDEIQMAPDFAIERARYRLTYTNRQDKKAVVETGRHVMSRKKVDGRWLIAWEIFNADPSAPPTAQAVAPPAGFRYPVEADFVGDWKTFRASVPTPFVVRADFDGDTHGDEAWLLPATAPTGYGVFVLSGAPGPARTWTRVMLDETNAPQSFGINALKPGTYKTLCGKGYEPCGPADPAELRLTLPAFSFFRFESASSIIWWDEKSRIFRETLDSD